MPDSASVQTLNSFLLGFAHPEGGSILHPKSTREPKTRKTCDLFPQGNPLSKMLLTAVGHISSGYTLNGWVAWLFSILFALSPALNHVAGSRKWPWPEKMVLINWSIGHNPSRHQQELGFRSAKEDQMTSKNTWN